MRADTAQFGPHLARMDESDIVDLLELQRLTRELLDRLLMLFSQQEAVDLLRAMADGLERATNSSDN